MVNWGYHEGGIQLAKTERFIVDTPKVKGATTVQVITDKETGVQYLLGMYATLGSGMTVLVDAEGKPLLNQAVLGEK